MPKVSSNQKTSQHNKSNPRSGPAAGPEGLSITPPVYGMDTSPVSELSIQRKADPYSAGGESPNRTGLPDALKTGVESLSGLAMDDVRVHYNSPKPAALDALAYAQGADIHIGPGQERHLPHEVWHVVQQAQGRVQPTMQIQSGAQVNDDQGLEHEADIMGTKALQKQSRGAFTFQFMDSPQATQVKAFQGIANSGLQVKQAAQLQAGSGVIQRVLIAGVNVTLSGTMPQWDDNGLTYHLNLTTDPPHVTCENWPKEGKKKGTTKMQFFFRREDGTITNAISGQRGKKKFSDLPQTVQTFISNNYTAILRVT